MALFGRRGSGRKQADTGVVIDLTDRESDAVSPSDARAEIVFGLPAPCPDCGLQGYLDHVNPLERVMYQHCRECGARWSIAEAEISASR